MYTLVHLKSGVKLAEFRDQRSARAAMRRANKNAGWTRISRSWSGGVELEWCARANGLPDYRHGPYAITDSETWQQYFSETQTVAV